MLASSESLAEASTKLQLSDKQWWTLGDSDARVNIWEGSIRSGKTFVSFLRWLGFVSEYDGPGSLIMVGKSRDTLWRNIFEPIEKDPALAFLQPFVHYRQGAMTAVLMGVKVNVVGANDGRAEAKIRGMTVGGAYGDELTTWHVDFFKQLLGRMSPPGAQFFGTTNPDNPQHWLKTEYLDKIGKPDADGVLQFPNWHRYHFLLDDNDTLTEEFRDSLRREFTGLWYKRFILGLWVSAEGAIYEDWDEEKHIIKWADLPPIARFLSVGVDYGTTNATVGILLALTDETDAFGRPAPRLIAVDEFRYDSKVTGHRLPDARLAKKFVDWLKDDHLPEGHPQHENPPPIEFVFLDPSAASFSEALQELGVTSWAADNDVSNGIQDVASLLAQGLLVVADHCPGLILEAPGYMWSEKATKNGNDAPVKENDHSMDGWRYSVRSTKGNWQGALRQAA